MHRGLSYMDFFFFVSCKNCHEFCYQLFQLIRYLILVHNVLGTYVAHIRIEMWFGLHSCNLKEKNNCKLKNFEENYHLYVLLLVISVRLIKVKKLIQIYMLFLVLCFHHRLTLWVLSISDCYAWTWIICYRVKYWMWCLVDC